MNNPSFGPLEDDAPTKRETCTMTLVLSAKEMEVLDTLAKQMGLPKAGLLRQALRLYQMVDLRLHEGLQMAFVDKKGEVQKAHILGLGPLADGYTERRP